MTFEVHYSAQYNCVIGQFSGVLNSRTYRGYAEEAANVMQQNASQRLLNDVRKAMLAFSVADLDRMMEYLTIMGLGDQSWRRALVVSGNLEDYAFYENTCHNRGYAVKVFTDKDSAMHWLQAAN